MILIRISLSRFFEKILTRINERALKHILYKSAKNRMRNFCYAVKKQKKSLGTY